MENLLVKLKAGKNARHPVELGGVRMEFRLLSEQDYMDAGIAVIEQFKSQSIALDMASAELFEAEKATQLLIRALFAPGSDEPVAMVPKQLNNALSRDEKNWLVTQYLDFEKHYSPSERNMTDQEFASLLEEVKKTPQTTRLHNSSSDTLRRLITVLASRPAN